MRPPPRGSGCDPNSSLGGGKGGGCAPPGGLSVSSLHPGGGGWGTGEGQPQRWGACDPPSSPCGRIGGWSNGERGLPQTGGGSAVPPAPCGAGRCTKGTLPAGPQGLPHTLGGLWGPAGAHLRERLDGGDGEDGLQRARGGARRLMRGRDRAVGGGHEGSLALQQLHDGADVRRHPRLQPAQTRVRGCGGAPHARCPPTHTHTPPRYLLSCFWRRSSRVSTSERCRRLMEGSGMLRAACAGMVQRGSSWYCRPRLSPQKLKMLDTPEKAPGGGGGTTVSTAQRGSRRIGGGHDSRGRGWRGWEMPEGVSAGRGRSGDPPPTTTPERRPHLRGGCTYRCPCAPRRRGARGLHPPGGGCGKGRARPPPGWARGARPRRWRASWRASWSGRGPTRPAPAAPPVPGSSCPAAAPSARSAAPRRCPRLWGS